MPPTLFLLPMLLLLLNPNPSKENVSIYGSYEWECSSYSSGTLAGIEFNKATGRLTIDSFPDALAFNFMEGDKSYQFKITRALPFDYKKSKNDYKQLRLVDISSDPEMKLQKAIRLLAYLFLLQESYAYPIPFKMLHLQLDQKLKKRIRKYKLDEKRDYIPFEIYDQWRGTNDKKYVDNAVGIFNLNSATKNTLECMFETFLPTSCCLYEQKGIMTMKKVKS